MTANIELIMLTTELIYSSVNFSYGDDQVSMSYHSYGDDNVSMSYHSYGDDNVSMSYHSYGDDQASTSYYGYGDDITSLTLLIPITVTFTFSCTLRTYTLFVAIVYVVKLWKMDFFITCN